MLVMLPVGPRLRIGSLEYESMAPRLVQVQICRHRRRVLTGTELVFQCSSTFQLVSTTATRATLRPDLNVATVRYGERGARYLWHGPV